MAISPKTTKKKDAKSSDEGLFFPSNIVPAEEEAQTSWGRQWVEAIRRYSYFTVNQTRDCELYNYAQGKVNDADFAHVTEMFFDNKSAGAGGIRRALPSKLRPVNSINHLLTRIIGKVDAVDLNFTANAVNEDAITKKFENFSDSVVDKATRFIRQQTQVGEIVGQPLVEGDDIKPEKAEEIEAMHITNFREENEINVSYGLKYLLTKKRGNLKWKLNHKMLYNYLITGKMAFDNYIEYGDPGGFCVDSRYLIYDLESGSPFIHDGRFNGYWFPSTPQQVIEMCPELSEDDLTSLDNLSKMFLAGKTTTNGYWYKDGDVGMYYLNCYKIYWKAVKWTKMIIEDNPIDKSNPFMFFVGDEEKPKEGQKVEYRPINTWWECTRIGEDIYYQCREIPGQQRPMDSPSESWSPLTGFVDDLPSPVQVLQPFDAMKKIGFYSLERLIGQAKGKILIVDEATEEDGQQNLYNMMAFNVYKINSAKEGEQQLGGNKHIEPKEIDLGLSQAVGDLMRFIAFLDMQMALVSGINEAAQGVTKSDTGLGVTQAAIEASQLTLQPYYYNFYNMCETVLQSQANLMKKAWGGKSKIGWILGDKAQEFFRIDPKSDWHLDDYGIFVQTGVRSEQNKQLILKMAEQLLPTVQEPEMALSIIKMFNAASGTEAEKILEKGIEAVAKIRKETQAFQSQQQEQALQIQAQSAQIKAQSDKDKADALKQVAIINAQSAEAIADKKLGHSEDMNSVKFKQDVLAEVAKHLLAQDMQVSEAELQPPQQMP